MFIHIPICVHIYREKANDREYAVGRRIKVKENDVLELVNIIKKISNKIKQYAK